MRCPQPDREVVSGQAQSSDAKAEIEIWAEATRNVAAAGPRTIDYYYVPLLDWIRATETAASMIRDCQNAARARLIGRPGASRAKVHHAEPCRIVLTMANFRQSKLAYDPIQAMANLAASRTLQNFGVPLLTQPGS